MKELIIKQEENEIILMDKNDIIDALRQLKSEILEELQSEE